MNGRREKTVSQWFVNDVDLVELSLHVGHFGDEGFEGPFGTPPSL